MQVPKKILVVRFSSIGDVVLITPVIRAIKNHLPATEVHVITKTQFKCLLEENPHLAQVHGFSKSIEECLPSLKEVGFDLVVDLHNNVRSKRLLSALGVKSLSFNKINIRKFFAVYFKWKSLLPPQHVVERYAAPLKSLGIALDQKGLEVCIAPKDEVDPAQTFGLQANTYIALVIGGSYHTKKMPVGKLREIIQNTQLPVLLLGGVEDLAVADQLLQSHPELHSAVGRFSIMQSASLVKSAAWVITGDTGLMHIASAFNKRIISVWGNTVPQFGMSPYQPHPENLLLEVPNLPCRPCSKLGYKQCPIGHFNCMEQQSFEQIRSLR